MKSHVVAPVSALAAVVLGISALTINSPADAAAGRTLAGSVPSWADSTHKVGAVDDSTTTTFRVYLDWSNSAAAEQYAYDVSTRGSANFHKFLTPAQFRSRFSPSVSSVSALKTWLGKAGFKVGTVPANRKYVEATGTLAKAASAFQTSFAEYKVNGKTVRGNNKPLVVPSSLTNVQAVVGLDESQTLATSYATKDPVPAGFRNAPPLSDYWGQKRISNTPTPDGTVLPASPDYAFAPKGYSGIQLQNVYGVADNIAAGNDGTGVTVAVIDAYASSTVESDVNTYSTRHGLPTFKKGQFSQLVAPGTYGRPANNAQDPAGWAGEETLDIEAVHTAAPGANILYVGAPNNYRDLDAVMNRVVDGKLADIVTNSYGYAGESLPTGYIKPGLDTQIQAAAEGMTLFFSSGDSADHSDVVGLANATPDWPASSPLVTAVGGTSIGIGADNRRVFELGWESGTSTLSNGAFGSPTFLYGSGGGTSRLFAQPSYQAGVVPDSISKIHGGAAARAVPDVSAIGDPNTGMLVGETQEFPDGTYYDEYRIGGTSLSSPLYAGLFALVVQAAGHDYGLANPALYAAAATSYDVTKTDISTYPGEVRVNYVNGVDATDGYRYILRTFDQDDKLSIHVRPGYDDVTGVGSPTEAWFGAVAAY
ncbi:S53 family peptidase [Nocardioides sp. NPDC126508]